MWWIIEVKVFIYLLTFQNMAVGWPAVGPHLYVDKGNKKQKIKIKSEQSFTCFRFKTVKDIYLLVGCECRNTLVEVRE